jgi:hypothetical protein
VFAGTDNAYKLARKYNVKNGFWYGHSVRREAYHSAGAILAKMVRWYTPAETLKMATADNGELMALSGLSIPTLANLAWSKRAQSPRNFLVLMKGGTIYKDIVTK